MTELSTAERARLDEFEARPAAEEACVERVARAIGEADGGEWDGGMGDVLPVALLPALHARYRRLAAAAIDAMRPAPDAPRTGGRL